MKLVEEWREGWKWLSVQFAALIAAVDFIDGHWLDLQPYLPEQWAGYLAVLILVGRFIKQKAAR